MEIILRGKQYQAEHLTDLNYLPIGNLFLDSDGKFSLSEVENYEALSHQQKYKLTQPMMLRLSNPDTKAAIAQSISAIFPNLPKDLVSYSGGGSFKLNLQLQELLEVAIALGNALHPLQTDPNAQKIAALEEEVARLRASQQA